MGGKYRRSPVFFGVAAHGEVIDIHRIESGVGIPCFIKMHPVGALRQKIFRFLGIVADSIISAVGKNDIISHFSGVGQGGVVHLFSNCARSHFSGGNRPDNAVAVSGRNHINWNRSRLNQPLFN